jgi:hypothetical protein
MTRLTELPQVRRSRAALDEFNRLRCPGVPTAIVNGKDRVDWAVDVVARVRGPLDARAIRATELPDTTMGEAMADVRIVATGLRFPEGHVAMADGSVILG